MEVRGPLAAQRRRYKYEHLEDALPSPRKRPLRRHRLLLPLTIMALSAVAITAFLFSG